MANFTKMKLWLLTMLLLVGSVVWGQGALSNPIFTENFGTLANGTAITTSNTSFSYVRLSTGAGTKSINSKNPSEVSTGASAVLIAPTSSVSVLDKSSLASFSSGTLQISFRTPTSFTFSTNNSNNGKFTIGIGSGNSFGTANTPITGAQMAAGFQVVSTSTSNANLNIKSGGGTTFQTVQTLATNSTYTVTLVFNNTAQGKTYGENNTLPTNTVDIWINGIKASTQYTAGVSSLAVNALRLYVETASFEVDDIALYNTLPATSSCTTPTHSFATASVSKLTTDAAFTNAFTSQNTSTKVWSSSNTAVATVDANGEVTIVGAGSTNIQVTQVADATYCAVSASYALTVSAPPTPTITLTPATLTGFNYAHGAGPSAEQSFTLSGANLTHDISLTAPANYEISKTSDTGFAASLDFAQTGGDVSSQTVYVRLKANLSVGNYDSEIITASSTGADNKTVTVSGSVSAPPSPEPSAHVTGFDAVEDGQNAIILDWTDAAGADGYLIKASTTSFEAITAPVDGTPETNGTLVKNVTQGDEIVEFTGLAAGTTYYFKIWPYSNSGASIDYKTDGSVPEASATTEAPLGIPIATAATNISASGFTANWNTTVSATAYDLSVYTKTTIEMVDKLNQEFTWAENGTGGNDDFWSGTIAGATTGLADHLTNWEVTSGYKGYNCIRLGSGSVQGILTTPELGLTGNATLTFRAGAWNGTTEQTELLLEISGGGSLSVSSINMVKAAFQNYTVTINGGTSTTKVTFKGKQASNSRFFIDDVVISEGGVTINPITGSPFTVTGETQRNISDLNSGTAYYYTVVAKNSSETSLSSNEIISITNIENALDISNLPDCPTCDLVINEGGDVTINASKTYNTVTLAPQAKLTVNSGQTLTVSGNLTLESNAAGTATLVDNGTISVTGTITAQQYLAGSRNWYVASPVSNANALGAGFEYWQYNEPDGSSATENWTVVSASTPLVPGRGYVVKPSGETTYAFSTTTGTLNTGNVTVPLTRTVGVTKEGFNLVGNPYPSYLNLNDLLTGDLETSYWMRSRNAGNTAWIFDSFNKDGNVAVNNSGKTVTTYVPPMQSFWVRVKSGVASTNLVFNNTMRAHIDVTNNRFRAPQNTPLIRLEMSNGTASDQTVLYAHADASDAFDRFDTHKMLNNSATVPDIYSMLGSQKLVINGMQSLPLNIEMPLGILVKEAGNFSIRVSEMRAIDADIVLIDKLNGNAEWLLNGGAEYQFASSTTTHAERFALVLRAPGTTTGECCNDILGAQTMVFVDAFKNININCAMPVNKNAKVAVYNAVGQMLTQQNLENGVARIAVANHGVYLVELNVDGLKTTKRVIVK